MTDWRDKTTVDDKAVSGARAVWRFIIGLFAVFGLICLITIIVLIAVGKAIIPGVLLLGAVI